MVGHISIAARVAGASLTGRQPTLGEPSSAFDLDNGKAQDIADLIQTTVVRKDVHDSMAVIASEIYAINIIFLVEEWEMRHML